MPIITRIYGPEELGIFNIYLSITALLTIVFTLGLQHLVTLVKSRDHIESIYNTSITFSIVVSIAFLAPLALGYAMLTENFSCDLVFVGGLSIIGSLILALGSISEFANFKYSFFQSTSRSIAIQSILNNLGKIFFGLLGLTNFLFLIFSTIFAQTIKLILNLNKLLENKKISKKFLRVSLDNSINILKNNPDFPLYRMPQMFINGISQHLPVFILSAFFLVNDAAYYGLVVLMLNMPTSLVGNVLSNVLYPKFAKKYLSNNSSIRKELRSFTYVIGLLGIMPVVIVYFFGEEIFQLIFGEEWIKAGTYATFLVLNSFMMLVSRPSISVIPIYGKQRLFFIFEILSSSLRFMSLLVPALLGESSEKVILSYSLTSSLTYLIIIIYVLNFDRE